LEYIVIERAPDAFQQQVALEDICRMCKRAFGEQSQIESVKELGGGLYNNTYLIRIEGMPHVILRVGPHQSRLLRHERNLMRNEHYSQPLLAPIAPLMPKTLMVDFTQQILERDYIFQTFMEGEQWASIQDELTPEENSILWRQLGSITKRIHSVEGEVFGSIYEGPPFSRWSLAVIHWLTNVMEDIEEVQLDARDLRTALEMAQNHLEIFDEITRPHLLHGDLWTVNLLVERGEPRITAVLDSDGTSWGDPMADWPIFLLCLEEHAQAKPFWQTYGQTENSREAEFRRLIYSCGFIGGARLEHHRLKHNATVMRSYEHMQAVIAAIKESLR